VDNGFAITLFAEDNFQGENITFIGSESDLGGLDGIVASMKVRCLESLQDDIANENSFAFNAKAESKSARLDITTTLDRSADRQLIERYNGAIGDFEVIAEFDIEDVEGEFTYYDESPKNGDNIYRVRVQYLDGTEEETAYKVVRFRDLLDANVFPNPANQFVNVDVSEFIDKDIEVFMYNLTGQQVDHKQLSRVSEARIQFNTANQVDGTYLIRIISTDGDQVTKKFTVAH